MSTTYRYPRPAIAVDCAVFSALEQELRVLLVRRAAPPFADAWALPGGFVHVDETLDEAAQRELQEETALKVSYLEQLYTFGALERDPRERVVSVAYYALVKPAVVKAGSDAAQADWHTVDRLPALAFDHAEILELALGRLRAKIRYEPIGFELLPNKFTLGQLQRLYESILGRALDARNFRRTLLKMGILNELDEMETGVRHRPSRLYRFNRTEYKKRLRSGYNFEL